MRTIWKYDIPLDDVFSIEMPKESKILTIATQRGQPRIWVEVPAYPTQQEDTIRRLFYLLGTGIVALDLTNLEYIGSFLILNDSLVFHLYVVANYGS
jgi:hypothetical protein